jgi:hypothetical protein
MMAACRMDKVSTVEQAMYSETETYRKINASSSYPAATGQAFTGANAGVACTEMAELMNSLGMGIWTGTNIGDVAVPDAIASDASVFQLCTVPIIAAVQWTSGTGQHWVLIDQVFNLFGHKYAIVNDPWDANIHIVKLTSNQRLTYNSKKPTFTFDVWGNSRSYNDTGYFYGDVVRCTGMNVTQRVRHAFLA